MRLVRRQPKETRSQRCAQRSTSLSDRAKARDGPRICHRIRTPTDPSQCDVTLEMTCISDSRLDDIVTSDELQQLDPTKGEHVSAAYAAVNPNKRIPAMEDEGFIL